MMALSVPSSQLPEMYLPDWGSINQKLAQTRNLNSQTTLQEAKAEREQTKENALTKYMKTGNLQDLAAGDPATALSFSKEERQNKMLDASLKQKEEELLLSRMKFIQTTLPNLTLETYPMIYQYAKGVFPQTNFPDPGAVTQADIDRLRTGGGVALQSIAAKLNGEVLQNQERQANLNRPTYNQYQQGDQTVTTRYTPNTGEQTVGAGPKWSDSGMFFKTTLPDGTPIEFGTAKGKSGASAQTGMQPTTARKIEEQLVADLGTLSDLTQIANTYKTGMQTFKEKASNVWTATKDKLGLGTVTQEQEDDLKKITVFRQNAIKNMNNYIKNITGAALSEKEADRIRQGMPDPGLGMMNGLFSGDSDIEFTAKLDQSTTLAKRAVWKGNYMRKYGLSIQNMPEVDSPEFVELMRSEQMKPIVNERGTQIYNQVKQSNPGMSEAELQKETQARLANDLGLAY